MGALEGDWSWLDRSRASVTGAMDAGADGRENAGGVDPGERGRVVEMGVLDGERGALGGRGMGKRNWQASYKLRWEAGELQQRRGKGSVERRRQARKVLRVGWEKWGKDRQEEEERWGSRLQELEARLSSAAVLEGERAGLVEELQGLQTEVGRLGA